MKNRTVTPSCDERTLAKFCHEGLNGFHIGFTLLDTTRNSLKVTKMEVLK